MPNLVHSFDAANICLMIDYLIKNSKNINIFCVHDCFSSTANSIEIINNTVRYAFLMIYSDNKFLENLHNHFIHCISSNYSIDEKNIVISPEDEELLIPLPPIVDDLNLRDKIQKAVYFIH